MVHISLTSQNKNDDIKNLAIKEQNRAMRLQINKKEKKIKKKDTKRVQPKGRKDFVRKFRSRHFSLMNDDRTQPYNKCLSQIFSAHKDKLIGKKAHKNQEANLLARSSP